ncbi:hypothetical protein GWK47_035589 [Chionoecetes opilio]|uniref:Fanconi Anaemia group E protein C-terminal domain-containing protein n=1 Tax=Chionoecetes opilio TaxID=41210 RepID=A0A8J4YTZ2_CHIOP|nr:hypothetical protein GWK47_035589 [Chionoecetes opilio]
MVALVGKILLLPKNHFNTLPQPTLTLLPLSQLYHLTSKLTTPVMDCLKQLLEVHAAVVIDSCLLPLLSLLPSLQEHHKDIIQHLAPLCAPRLATCLLSTYSERLDTDLPIFQLLCECADFRATDTHTAALAVLTRLAPQHHTSTKFGQCLLSVLRRYGPHLQELKGFRFVVNSHASSLRKLVEMQMKKLEKIK